MSKHSIAATKPGLASLTLAIVVSLGFGGLANESRASWVPLDVTGFNRDVVVEIGSIGPEYFTAMSVDAPTRNESNNNAFYEAGLGELPKGLPTDRRIQDAFINATYVLQPYDRNNSLRLDPSDSSLQEGTLTLALEDQVSYSRIAILATGGNVFGPAKAPVRVNFHDGSFLTTQYNMHDWFFVDQDVVINNVGRVNLVFGHDDSSLGNPRLYRTLIELPGEYRSRRVISVTFGVNESKPFAFPNILAISARPVPEPSALALITLLLWVVQCVQQRTTRRRD